MIQRAYGVVEKIISERPQLQELLVRLDAVDGQVGPGESRKAMNLLDIVEPVDRGDRVIVNTTAVNLGLGTGGYDIVLARLEGAPAPVQPQGHIMKLRYTPLQVPVLAIESPESPHHEALKQFDTLEDMPVVCAELLSQVPAICAAVRWALDYVNFPRAPKIVFIMTDGAALPLGVSHVAAQLSQCGLVDCTITAGQAFGGDLEAINLYSALAAARVVVNADVAVVCQGPGNAGTGTPLGFSGIQQAEALNAAGALGGVPIAVARMSFADIRERHRGMSHHTVTVLQRITLVEALLPIPRLPEKLADSVNEAINQAGIASKHQPIVVDADLALDWMARYPIEVTTMGRPVSKERPFFLAAAAAGVLAAQVIEAGLVTAEAICSDTES